MFFNFSDSTQGMITRFRRFAFEVMLILILSLLLSLVYNALSPNSIRVLPKKSPDEKTDRGKEAQSQICLQGTMIAPPTPNTGNGIRV